jgi:putative membrane protein (TIGR04086 family)
MEKSISIRWGRVILTSVGAYLVGLLLITIVLTAYAFKLGFEVRGAPDQTRITQFAEHYASSWGMVVGLLLTFGAAIWVARKVRTAAAMHGVAVGVTVAVLSLIVGLLIEHSFGLRTLVDFAATVGAGWLGGFIGGRAKTETAAEPSAGRGA